MKWPDKITIKINLVTVVKWAKKIWKWRRNKIVNKDVLD